MRRFAKTSIGLLLLNIGIAAVLFGALEFWERRFPYENWETESSVLITPENAHMDLMVLGTSHGRVLSRDKNHERVERILGMEMVNLSKGGGAGVVPANVFLAYFYEKGNRADRLLYVMDPWVFYSREWNEAREVYYNEPFDLRFLRLLVLHGIERRVIFNYLQEKFQPWWWRFAPEYVERDDRVLPAIAPDAYEQRVAASYLDGTDDAVFDVYAGHLKNIVEEANAHGARIYLILPPTLVGELPGTQKLLAFANDLARVYPVTVADFTRAIPERTYYYNHDHLNTNGVEFFTKEFLLPLLTEAENGDIVENRL